MNGPFLSVKSGIRVGRPIDPDPDSYRDRGQINDKPAEQSVDRTRLTGLHNF